MAARWSSPSKHVTVDHDVYGVWAVMFVAAVAYTWWFYSGGK
jgi:hypothetical protein